MEDGAVFGQYSYTPRRLRGQNGAWLCRFARRKRLGDIRSFPAMTSASPPTLPHAKA